METFWYKHVFKYDYIHEHFQVWFLIGKNYILQRKNTDFSTITNAYELTNIFVDVLKIHESQVISKVRISKDMKKSSSGRFILNTFVIISKHLNTYIINFCNGAFN